MFEQPNFEAPPECPVCLQTLRQSYGCRDDRSIKFADGEVREPVPYGDEERYQGFMEDGRETVPVSPCDQCGAMPGYYHHTGCPEEACPKCGEQYQMCDCSTDEKLRISDNWMTQESGSRSGR